MIILVPLLRCSQILRNINRRPVASLQDFLIHPMFFEIYPYRLILFLVKQILFQPFLDDLSSQQVSIRFIIILIKLHLEPIVSSPESIIHPSIHFFPQFNLLFNSFLPLQKHFTCFLPQDGILIEVLVLIPFEKLFLRFLSSFLFFINLYSFLTGLPGLIFFLKPALKQDRKSTRLNSSHVAISYAVFCL